MWEEKRGRERGREGGRFKVDHQTVVQLCYSCQDNCFQQHTKVYAHKVFLQVSFVDYKLSPECWFYSCIVRMSGSHPLLCPFVSRYWIQHYWVLEYNLGRNVIRLIHHNDSPCVQITNPQATHKPTYTYSADCIHVTWSQGIQTSTGQVTKIHALHIIRKYNSLPTTYLRQLWRGQSSKRLVLYKESTKKDSI